MKMKYGNVEEFFNIFDVSFYCQIVPITIADIDYLMALPSELGVVLKQTPSHSTVSRTAGLLKAPVSK